MNFNKYSTIIWDWNGTLFNDAEFCMNIMNKLLAKRNLQAIDKAKYRSVFTFPLQDYYKAVGHDLSNGNFTVLVEEFMEYYESGKFTCELHNKTVETLGNFCRMGMRQYMLSAYSQHTLEELIKHYGIAEYFETINGNDNIFAEGKLGLAKSLISSLSEPEAILMIGDTLHDSEIAAELGTGCILISAGHQSAEKLSQSGNFVLSSIEELYSFTK